MNKPTLMEFVNYEIVRRYGKFNMITEWWSATKEAGLSIDKYKNVINNYNWCLNQWKDKKFKINSSDKDCCLCDEIFNFEDALLNYNAARNNIPNSYWELEVIND